MAGVCRRMPREPGHARHDRRGRVHGGPVRGVPLPAEPDPSARRAARVGYRDQGPLTIGRAVWCKARLTLLRGPGSVEMSNELYIEEVDEDGSTDSLDLEGRDVRSVRDHSRFGYRAGDPAAQPGPDRDGGLAARGGSGRAVPSADRTRRNRAEAVSAP